LNRRLFISLGLLAGVITLLFFVLEYVEDRSGVVIERGWLDAIPPYDHSLLIFSMSYLVILFGIVVCVRRRESELLLIRSYLLLQFFRCITLLLVPLDPPDGIIPLDDPFLESTFYNGRMNLKDLFFSGHIGTMLLFAFILRDKWMKGLVIGFTILTAILLVVQRVHYITDVAAAPVFAFLAFFIARRWTSAASSSITSS
jgi:hypothetical protein